MNAQLKINFEDQVIQSSNGKYVVQLITREQKSYYYVSTDELGWTSISENKHDAFQFKSKRDTKAVLLHCKKYMANLFNEIKTTDVRLLDPVLHLNVHKKWFDMIKSGKKKVEYREIKEYYNRLFEYGHIQVGGEWFREDKVKIIFSNGYSKNRPTLIAQVKSISQAKGIPELGAEAGKYYWNIEFELI